MNTLTAASFPVTVAALTGYLPPIAALLSIIWLVIQIAASINTWLEKRKLARGPRGLQGIQGIQGPQGEKGEKGTGHDTTG